MWVKIFCLLAIVLVCGSGAAAGELPRADPEAAGMSTIGLQRLNDVMRAHVDAGDIQGAVTAVARFGKVVHLEAYGMLDVRSRSRCPEMPFFVWHLRQNQS